MRGDADRSEQSIRSANLIARGGRSRAILRAPIGWQGMDTGINAAGLVEASRLIILPEIKTAPERRRGPSAHPAGPIRHDKPVGWADLI